MEQFTRIFFDCLINLYDYFLLMELCKNIGQVNLKPQINKLFACIIAVYALTDNIPFGSYVGQAITFAYIILTCYPNWKNIIKIFIISYLCCTFVPVIISLLSSLILFDGYVILENPYYLQCKTAIDRALVYILYILYIHGRRMRKLNSRYYHLFTGVIISITLMLSYLTLYICQTQEMSSALVPILFSSLFILIAVCINIYRHFIELIEENIHAQFTLERNKITEEYSEKIEANLKELHSLRHDIRNHLIIIDGYASQKRFEDIHQYIEKITDNYTDVPLFDTTSDVVSALLNTKYHIAKEKGIDFTVEWNFPYVHIEDFSMITILGNLIDNAITAAEKCEHGWITLEMIQSDTYLGIHIQNNHVNTIVEKNGEFKTSKKDTSILHGIGIKNIRSTVEQLNGQIDISYNEEIFEVDILVPNY